MTPGPEAAGHGAPEPVVGVWREGHCWAEAAVLGYGEAAGFRWVRLQMPMGPVLLADVGRGGWTAPDGTGLPLVLRPDPAAVVPADRWDRRLPDALGRGPRAPEQRGSADRRSAPRPGRGRYVVLRPVTGGTPARGRVTADGDGWLELEQPGGRRTVWIRLENGRWRQPHRTLQHQLSAGREQA